MYKFGSIQYFVNLKNDLVQNLYSSHSGEGTLGSLHCPCKFLTNIKLTNSVIETEIMN